MIVGTLTVKLYAPWVHSLKEKRMIVRSLVAKTQNKFNISIAEVDFQELHQTIVLGIACVGGTMSLVDSVMDHVIGFIEGNCEAEILSVEREIR